MSYLADVVEPGKALKMIVIGRHFKKVKTLIKIQLFVKTNVLGGRWSCLEADIRWFELRVLSKK